MHIWTLGQRNRVSSFFVAKLHDPCSHGVTISFSCSLCRELFPSSSANPELLSSCLARLNACNVFGWKWTGTSDRLACALAESDVFGTKKAKTLCNTKGASLCLQHQSQPHQWLYSQSPQHQVQATNFWFLLSTCAAVVWCSNALWILWDRGD